MKLDKIIIGLLILVFSMACSREEEQVPSPQVEVVQQEPVMAIHPVLPIEISPEDQALADQAPEGMVFIKGGCFTMGNEGAQSKEKPEHEVCVDDFYMSKYEVTQNQWENVTGINPSKFPGTDNPVEQVNHIEVQQYVEKSNGECRLPTEAEWEYAAGGKTRTRYYWGNLMDGNYAWFEDNSEGVTHPVGQKQPNQFGLYDMSGNVWEWVADWYAPLYDPEDKNNPSGPETGDYKVIRGGALDSSAGALRTTNRNWLHPKNRVYSKVTTYGGIINEIINYVGFRCAKSIPKEKLPVE